MRKTYPKLELEKDVTKALIAAIAVENEAKAASKAAFKALLAVEKVLGESQVAVLIAAQKAREAVNTVEEKAKEACATAYTVFTKTKAYPVFAKTN